MATVAETLAKFDQLEKTKHRPTLYKGRWDAFKADLATLQDGSGSQAGAAAAAQALEDQELNPTQYHFTWSAVRDQIAVLADAP